MLCSGPGDAGDREPAAGDARRARAGRADRAGDGRRLGPGACRSSRPASARGEFHLRPFAHRRDIEQTIVTGAHWSLPGAHRPASASTGTAESRCERPSERRNAGAFCSMSVRDAEKIRGTGPARSCARRHRSPRAAPGRDTRASRRWTVRRIPSGTERGKDPRPWHTAYRLRPLRGSRRSPSP